MSIRKNWQGGKWSPEDQARLRASYRSDRFKGALRAFPERTVGSVFAAVRRYCFEGAECVGSPNVIDAGEIRRRLNALPLETFVEGVERLTTWKAGAS